MATPKDKPLSEKKSKTASSPSKKSSSAEPTAASKRSTVAAAPKPNSQDQPLPPENEIEQQEFLGLQKERLLVLKDTLLDSMSGVAKDNLRSRAEGSEASAFGMHQADAGSDAYDRDFALSLLSQEQDSLYEIDEALKRLENGTYGICEMSGKQIPQARLEALPFTRYTVECQEELEKRSPHPKIRQPVTSLFGLTDEEGEGEDEDSSDNKE